MVRWVLLVLAFAVPAWAGPDDLAWQGRLLGGDGQPVNGPRSVTFALFDAVSAGTQIGTTITLSLTPADGYASADLVGWANHLATATGPLWLEVSVDSTPMSREPLTGVPYAVVGSRVRVEGGASGSCGESGAIRWDTALASLRVCDGSTWRSVAPSGGGVPSGAVMAFDLASCPSGWTLHAAAQGRVVVGGGTVGVTQGSALSSGGTRGLSAVPRHLHVLRANSSGSHIQTATPPGHPPDWDTSDQPLYQNVATGYSDPPLNFGITTGYAGTADTVDVTMPYLQLLYCKKT